MANKNISRKSYVGFGGWLVLFAASLFVQFIRLLLSILDNYSIIISDEFKLITDPDSEYYNSSLYPSLIVDTILSLFICIMIIFIIYFCIRHSIWFKKLSVIYIISSFIIQCLTLFWLLGIHFLPEEFYEEINIYQGVISSLAYMLIWLPYLLISKRVKNTYA
ncbi:DUF2569 family protein [Paenibacillus sp. FSL R10-2736]|uniref:DUF2569 family protein n=1 Tax=Paenibacillus sp. FSL R10-2736 TaxID=2954692 RepID=UPI004046A0EC